LPQVAVVIPFGIFLMRTFFRGIPNELIDAARTDGANEFELLLLQRTFIRGLTMGALKG